MNFIAAALFFQLAVAQQPLNVSVTAEAKPIAGSAALSTEIPKNLIAKNSLPDAPSPASMSANTSTASSSASSPAAEPGTDALSGIYIVPNYVSAVSGDDKRFEPVEPSRRAWLMLLVAEHSAATFDAWSTRRSVASGNIETNPILKPFAGSDAIYGAIQGTPLVLDFVGRRMQRSDSPLLRRMWWVPQAVMSSVSIYAGAHNVSITR